MTLPTTGCKSPTKAPPTVTPLPATQPARLIPAEPSPPKAATNRVLLPPTAPATNPVFSGWIPWESWSLANGTSKPQKSAPNAIHSFELRTSHGTLAITVGDRVAKWNGLACWLGFAPRLIDGRPFIHALDAQKNFLPLLVPFERSERTHPILVLDPGHGGKETGAQSVFNGKFEKDYTLDWALRVRPLLLAKGWRVVLTRTNDAAMALAQRVWLADQFEADLFVSLHFNAGKGNQQHCGLETYCLTPTGMPSSITREDYADDERAVFPNNAFDQSNLCYAIRLHRALLNVTGGVDLGVRRARFMAVLRGQKRPAVLIEGGYLSNPQEARLIADASYRQRLAEAVVQGLEGE